jgi:porin
MFATDLIVGNPCQARWKTAIPAVERGSHVMRAVRTVISLTFISLIALCVPTLAQEANSQVVSDVTEDSRDSPVSLSSLPERNCQTWLNEQETLTGNWRCGRPSLEERGITFDGSITQFYQGVSSGGVEQRFRYSGHGEYEATFDFGKLADIEGLSLELGSEHRFGETANPDTGSAIPVALLPDLPDPDINDLALTKVLFTQELSEDLEVFFGKMDTLEFDTNGFAYGNGRERFFSTAFNYDPIATKTIPFSTLGAGINVFRDGERLFSFIVINPEETSTISGFDVLFANGASMLAKLRLPTHFFGRTGHMAFGGTWSSRTYDSLEQETRVQFPDIQIEEKDGSWALFASGDQFLWEDPCDPSRGWGLFGRAGISDGNPNPIEWFLSVGIGGNSPIAGRYDDFFGVGWYYTGISDELGPVVSRLLGDGQGVELYYSIAVSEWFHVTPDLQIVDPNAASIDTAIVPGVRARIDF